MNERLKEPNYLNNTKGFRHEVEPIWHFLYRFLWPFQYFQDVSRGDQRQQQLRYQHNRSMRFCLPGFMLKWLALTVVLFSCGSVLDSQFSLSLLVVTCFVTGGLTLIVVLLLGVGWVWLDHFPSRF